VASIVGLLAGGLVYEWLGATAFLRSAAMTGLVFVFAFGIRRGAGPQAPVLGTATSVSPTRSSRSRKSGSGRRASS